MTSWMAKFDAITKGLVITFKLFPHLKILLHLTEEEQRRPGQRLPVSQLGNELMNKEQLYDLFQQILSVKKFEHQLLYNAMQVSEPMIEASTIVRFTISKY